MENERDNKVGEAGAEKGARGLRVVLGVLGVVIVGLVVGIVIIAVNGGSAEKVDDADEEYVGDYSEWDDPEAAKEYFELIERFDSIDDEATAMLSGSSADPEAVKDLYLERANQFIENGEMLYAVNVLLNGESMLEDNGYKKLALDLLMEFDLTKFDQYEQGVYERAKMYLIIIRLAEELGYDNIAADYRGRMAAVRDVYDYYWSLESWNRPVVEDAADRPRPSEDELREEVHEEE